MQQTENGLSRNVTSFQATNHLKLPRDSARQSVPRTKGPSPLVAQRKRECGLLRIKNIPCTDSIIYYQTAWHGLTYRVAANFQTVTNLNIHQGSQ